MSKKNDEEVNPEKNLVKMRKIIGVSSRIHELALQRKKSPPLISKDEEIGMSLAVAKELRSKRMNLLGPKHKYVLEVVGELFGMELDEMLDDIADNDTYIDILSSLFEADGRAVITFDRSIREPPNMQSGRFNPMIEDEPRLRVVCTDTDTSEMADNCVLVYRRDPSVTLDIRVLSDEIMFCMLDKEDGTAMNAMNDILANIIRPSVQNYKDYGKCTLERKQDFVQSLDIFLNYSTGTENDVKNRIDFQVDHDLFKGFLLAPYQIRSTSKMRHKVLEVEVIFRRWMEQMKWAIMQSIQIRRDPDDVGPTHELEYWRSMLTKFSSIVEFIESKPFKHFYMCLELSRSKLLKKWDDLNNDVTVKLNEVKDNVRHMTLIQRFWAPLYRFEPPEIAANLHSLILTIRSVYKTSHYYNTSERVSGFLVKVSNQLVLACQSYLTNRGKNSFWDINKHESLKKIRICVELEKIYRNFYQRTIEEMRANRGERVWECSEALIFVKLKQFLARLEQIKILLTTYITYNVLDKVGISGTEVFSNKIKELYNKIALKDYDPLSLRNKEFGPDFESFQENLYTVEDSIRNFLKQMLQPIPDVASRLLVLRRFERLNLGCLCLNRRYLDVALMLEKEMESIKDYYNEDRANPAIAWCVPPIVGRIRWSQFLYRKINDPIEVLKTKDCVIEHRKAQTCVKYYNYLAGVLLHYELLHHKAWYDFAEQVRVKLESPVFCKNQETFWLEVNFDSYILQLIKEAEAFSKLKMAIPSIAQILVLYKDELLNSYYIVTHLVGQNNKLKTSIPVMILPLFRNQLRQLEDYLEDGLTTITWLSQNIKTYLENTTKILKHVEAFLKDVIDMMNCRILEVTNYIGNTRLLLLPEESIDSNAMYAMNVAHRNEVEKKIDIKSLSAEKSAVELINKFVKEVHVPEYDGKGNRIFSLPLNEITTTNWRKEEKKLIDKFDWFNYEKLYQVLTYPALLQDHIKLCFKPYKEYNFNMLLIDSNELFSYFNQMLMNALVRATKLGLDDLKGRTKLSSLQKNDLSDQTPTKPLFYTDMELEIPVLKINPPLKAIQAVFERLMLNIIETNYAISTWGKQTKTEERKIRKPLLAEVRAEKNFFNIVNDHKETRRNLQTFDGGLMLLEPDLKEYLIVTYDQYKYLWADDREEQIVEFVETNPLTADIREKFMEFDGRTNDLETAPKIKELGTISINLEKAFELMIEESKVWKVILGRQLSAFYKVKLVEMVEFITDQDKILARQIKDLDDVRLAMKCLQTIRENFFRIDMALLLMEDTYALFHQFKISVPPADIERVDCLRYNFLNMMKKSQDVQQDIIQLQEPLKIELTEGVARFREEVEEFDRDFELRGPMVPNIPAKEASDRVLLFQNRFDELWRKYEMYESGEKLFGLEVQEYPILEKRKKEFQLLSKLYSLYLRVMKGIDDYNDLVWSEVDIEVINTELSEFQKKCRTLPKEMKDWPAFIDLKNKIENFADSCPLLEIMVNDGMKPRHWEKLEVLLNRKFDVESPLFTLGDIMSAPLLQYKDDIEDICIGAIKEKDIEAKLKQIVMDWSFVNLQFTNFKARGQLLIKASEVGDIIVLLEDSIMIINSLASNRYNAPFKKDILMWMHKLVSTAEILEKWLIVQNLWVYLEAVFVGGDISKQLPAEAKRFAAIDKDWVRTMSKSRANPNVIECCTGDDVVKQSLDFLFDQLESCQKSLTGYLETKRLIFPRFFFVSDPVLLEILGQSSDPSSIQPHLLSIFDAIAKVKFDVDNPTLILTMDSANGESVTLEKPVECVGGVELWLGKLLASMQETVKEFIAQMAQSFADPDFEFISGFQTFCGQGGLLGVQLLWTSDAEYALKKSRNDKNIMRKTNENFERLLNELIALTVLDLTSLQRIRFETMVTIHVHQRDIFDELVKLRIKSTIDFDWQKQARFYYEFDTDDCFVKITDVDFLYQNEYLGVTERLAITPLTDRCYITLAQAIGMHMGGAPAGPAGTGKTETTKDMGRALGKLVVVFNCSDQMDFRGLGRIYKGLAQSGSWGCFDEFNRIELPVLSVAAQQIHIVLSAKKEMKKQFLFSDGDIVALNSEFGIFITMNPGYAGRQELPENLKIMFRTVAMMVPDRQIIMRVKLASCGFQQNVDLARKFFVLYKLCEEQLSKQVHYDFGLRNILSVLRTLGEQKRSNPTDSEETIVMRVLKDMNLSKLIDEDEGLFLSLIEGLFPTIKLAAASKKALVNAFVTSAKKLSLIPCPAWILKVMQLYETHLVRHGIMTLGPTGAGKSKSIETLLDALTALKAPHKEMRMNPKAITAPQMFGRLDVATNDWTDGIFSTLWRRSIKMKENEYCWLVLDGPVDAVWIENLNSVLDDNKTLTLANGDRIVMSPNCKLVFEPDNVDNASPATVSRMGMVFMSSSVLKWNFIFEGWLQQITSEDNQVLNLSQGDVLTNLFKKIYDDLNVYVQTKLTPKMKILDALYIRQCCDILEGLLIDTPNSAEINNSFLERLFLFSLMWSLGAVLELDDRVLLEEFCVTHPSNLKWPKIKEGETIFEYFVTPAGQWDHWNSRVEELIYPDDSVPEYASILVPNVDNIRTAFLIANIAKQKKAVLLIGEQGTAKTVMIKGYMATYDPEEHLSKSFNFSSATTPNMFQRIIESYVEKRVGMTYGPPQQRKMSVFIDDVNMPTINEWGDQITNEIVRQMMEGGGFFSLEKPGDFTIIQDVQLLAAMIHPGGGRNDIPPRLKRRFCIFNCTLPSDRSMDKIFDFMGRGYFCPSRFGSEIVAFIPYLVALTRILWQQVKKKMLPTPAKFHYVFNLRDLSRIWEGMLTIRKEECRDIATALKLWRHECTRVIADRFTEFKDRDWFIDKMREVAEVYLIDHFEHYPANETFFVDFLREPPEATGDEGDDFCFDAPKIYEEIPSFEFTTKKVLFFMDEFNKKQRGGGMDLVFFRDAIIHLMIISRIIRTCRGNALLVGVGGSGKQSLTKLASHIAGYGYHQITLTRSYTASNLMDDFKYLYRTTGLDGEGISFIFTDNDIKEEGFLDYINNVLSSGEIANLFPKDEMDEILDATIPVMKKIAPKNVPTKDVLYDFFLTRARNNLHIVLCFSPVGQKFRNRSLKFPGLISGCTVDWFQKWPTDALIAVSSHFLLQFDIANTQEVKERTIDIMAYIHDNVADVCVQYYERFRRQTHVTPKSFLSFLEGFKHIYAEKKNSILQADERMKTGLVKLVEAAASTNIIRKELAVKEVVVNAAKHEAGLVLQTVQIASVAAEEVKADVLAAKNVAGELLVSIEADKAVAEGKLADAKPALDEAEAALKTIKSADIATVRKLGKPPYLITLIMDVVIILFRKRIMPIVPDPEKRFLTTSWDLALKVMADTRFLMRIVEYNKDLINAEIVDLMTPYFNHPLYTFESAKVACGNVAGLLSWTKAMAKFYAVNKEVLPLKANLQRQEAKRQKANAEMVKLTELLDEKTREFDVHQQKYNEAMGDMQVVLDEAQALQDKMDAAVSLIQGLSGEKIRWTHQSEQFKSETNRLVGDSIILTGFLSYTGSFNQEFRSLLQSNWHNEVMARKIPVSKNISAIERLTDDATIGEWNLQGLPNDEYSTQNGIIVTKAPRYPLLIDPQSQGKTWIFQKEKEFGLKVTQLNNRNFRTFLEDSLSLGLPLLIEDIGEELDPVLDNVLEKNLIKVGSSWKVKLGDKEFDYHESFRLYMTTKLPNPLYTPEIAARTSIIDFTVTIQGLEDQLLGRVILTEKKELEIERTALVKGVTENKRKQQELEINLLHKLSTTEGNLVDDVTVMQVLNTSKATSLEVNEKLAIAKTTEVAINIAREEYRPVATRGSVLYRLVSTMAMVNVMYQTSLVQFLERFDYSLANSEKTNNTRKRINIIVEYLTYDIFKYTSRGLYEIHKFLFVLLMSLNIDIQKGFVLFDEFQNFIKGGAALDINLCPPRPYPWISEGTWLNLVQLSTLYQFQNIVAQVSSNGRNWKNWYDKSAPEEESIPDGYNSLDPFRKLLLIRSWCTDRTLSQSRKYLAYSLGARFASPVILNYDIMLEESRPLTPLICFLSMGSDPTPSIEALAKKNGVKCRSISMGQGQEVHARKLIAESLDEGSWVLLQNCHLGLDYMNELMTLLMDFEKNEVVLLETFRVWITTEEHPQFPITLLQMSVKFTNEPPSGVRAGLKRTYTTMTLEMLEYSESPYYVPLIFAVSFLHTIVQERRKFGPLGWNIPYEFNSADWLASCYFMQNHLDDLDPKRGISWSTVRYMLGEVQYGGRVTDDYDKRLLNTFAKTYFCQEMFNESFVFFTGYPIMNYKSLEEYIENIEEMPLIDPPQVYGLHPNADITYQSNTSQSILSTILSVQPKESSAGGGETREASVTRQTKTMLANIPEPYDFYEVKKVLSSSNALKVFLKHEIDRIQKIILLVRATLSDLLLAIEGTIIMNEQLRDALDNIYDARVPAVWKKTSWLSSTLGFWFSELLERNNQFYNWCFKYITRDPETYWMSGFFNPQGFLTAMRQEVAKLNKWPLDMVTICNEVTKMASENVKSGPPVGVYIRGLYLDGAGWKKRTNTLMESLNKVLYTSMPIIHVSATNSLAPKSAQLYQCPVYKKLNRTDLNYITPLWLLSEENPDHWIIRGVALLCDIK